MAIIGIDLGTTNSLVSTWKDGKCVLIPNAYGEYLTPSIVYFEESGVQVGKYAKLKTSTESNQTLASFKRDMGTNREFTFFNKVYTVPEVASFVVRQLVSDAEAYLGEKVEEAVISVPAYFNDKQRNATRLAGELAGIKVERIINEPSTAALASRMMDMTEDKTYLVFDFGGGTLDISIVDVFENVIEIVSVSGDNHLGGDDFDEVLTRNFCATKKAREQTFNANELAIIKSQIRQMKHELSNKKEVHKEIVVNQQTYPYDLSDKKIVSICTTIFNRIHEPITKAVKDAGLSIDELDEVIMVGGSSKMSCVQKFVEFVCKKKPFVEENCDYTVARGCGMVTGILARNESIKDVVLTDICPFTLGVSSYMSEPRTELMLSPIIERNTVLPVSKTNIYSTIHNNQRVVEFDILQGEKRLAKDNLCLKSFSIEVPSKPAGQEQIEVCFTYDINGILVVEARVCSTGESFQQLVVDENTKITEEQLQEKVKELEALKKELNSTQKYDMLLARGEQLYTESIGQQRLFIANTITNFKNVLSTNRHGNIERMYHKISQIYDTIEKDNDLFIPDEQREEYLEDFNTFLEQENDDDDDDGYKGLN